MAVITLSLWVVLVWLPGWFTNSCSVLLVVLAYCSGFIQTILPARYLILGTALAYILALVTTKHETISRQVKLAAFGMLMVMGFLFCSGLLLAEAGAMDPLLRITVLFPVVGLLGFLLARTQNTSKVALVYVLVSTVMGTLAVAERLSGSFLVAGSYASSDRLFRDGSIRSIVFSEHPLVLSVLLLAAVPLVSASMKHLGLQFVAYVVLVGGVISTNSRGALIILLAWILLKVASRLGLLGHGASYFARFGVLVGIGIAFLGVFLAGASDQMSSSSALDASAEYRSTLYAFAGRSLLEMPWGWGLQGLPQGVYQVRSYFGTLDIANTVDSEIALAVFDFGWPGFLVLSALMLSQLSTQNLISPVGQASLIITISGFYLALHAWAGLGTIWFLVLGLTLGGVTKVIVMPSKSMLAQKKSPSGAASVLKVLDTST